MVGPKSGTTCHSSAEGRKSDGDGASGSSLAELNESEELTRWILVVSCIAESSFTSEVGSDEDIELIVFIGCGYSTT